jgi:hypothetical protein
MRNMKTFTGIIHGKTIELLESPGIAEGSQVDVVVTRSANEKRPGDGLLATEGALVDDGDWDAIMDEIEKSRGWERASRNGGK